MMQADGVNGDLEPWDWRYYSEKRRRAEHDLDEAALKPYLAARRDDRGAPSTVPTACSGWSSARSTWPSTTPMPGPGR